MSMVVLFYGRMIKLILCFALMAGDLSDGIELKIVCKMLGRIPGSVGFP